MPGTSSLESISAELQLRQRLLDALPDDASEAERVQAQRCVSRCKRALQSAVSQYKRHEREEKERAEVTLKSIADAVVTTDADGKIDYMNPVAEELTGWREAEVAGRPVTQVIRIVHETTREPYRSRTQARKGARGVATVRPT